MCRQVLLNFLWSFVRTLTLVVVDSSCFEMEECLHKMAISFLDLKELHNKINLSLPTTLIQRSNLIIQCNSSVVCLSLSLLIPLHPLVGLRPPSKIPSFCHSASLWLLYLFLLLSKTQFQKAFSLNAGDRSLLHSQPQWV